MTSATNARKMSAPPLRTTGWSSRSSRCRRVSRRAPKPSRTENRMDRGTSSKCTAAGRAALVALVARLAEACELMTTAELTIAPMDVNLRGDDFWPCIVRECPSCFHHRLPPRRRARIKRSTRRCPAFRHGGTSEGDRNSALREKSCAVFASGNRSYRRRTGTSERGSPLRVRPQRVVISTMSALEARDPVLHEPAAGNFLQLVFRIGEAREVERACPGVRSPP